MLPLLNDKQTQLLIDRGELFLLTQWVSMDSVSLHSQIFKSKSKE